MSLFLVDRAEVFSDILHRNALRREAQLPLLPVRSTYIAEVEKKLWIEYVQLNAERVQVDVLRELRVKRGADFPQSWGGRLAWSCLTQKALREGFLAQRST